MEREWLCILAGGTHHVSTLTVVADASLTFPPAITKDDGIYKPMTMTSSTREGERKTGVCVMAHSHASLEQVNEAHAILVRQPVDVSA